MPGAPYRCKKKRKRQETAVRYNIEGCWSHYSFNEDQDTESSQGGVFYSKLMGSNTKKPSKVVPFLFSNTNTKLIFQKE